MKVGIIGCGVMGGAIASRLSKCHEVFLQDHKEANAKLLSSKTGARILLDLGELTHRVEIIILAVKPKDFKIVSEKIAPHLKKNHLVISILAGVPLETLQIHFPLTSVFRVMPNLPLICGHGMLGIADDPSVDALLKQKVEEILKELGTIFWLQEKLMNAFTALTSSNPAFIYLIVEAMVEAGVTLGFKADLSLEFVLETIEGSVALLRESELSPSELKMRVTSPGGATIAGLNELENQGVRSGITQGIKRCYERAEEMGGS